MSTDYTNIKPARADYYDAAGSTELHVYAEQRAKRDGISYADALEAVAKEQSELVELHQLWTRAMGGDDKAKSALPSWLQTALYLARKAQDEAVARSDAKMRAETEPDLSTDAELAEAQKYGQALLRRGWSAEDAFSTARDSMRELYNDLRSQRERVAD